jgi:ketosteroid isomerase-like protein
MKQVLCILLLVFNFSHIEAQNAEALIKAEKAFEKSCLQLGIRDGFLAWVDPAGIEFSEKGPSNAKQLWLSYPAFEGIFLWAPSYAEMSISGDWGYTTGNYEHRAKSLRDSVDDAGQYTTVWHKNKTGEWKYLIDIGNKHTPVAPQRQAVTILTGKFKASRYTDSIGLADLERIFISSFEKDISNAYRRFGGSHYILNLPEHQLVNGTDSAVFLLHSCSSVPLYQVSGIFISPGRDMAAVYGTIRDPVKTGSYLRIWRYEKEGWKIALEVIRT